MYNYIIKNQELQKNIVLSYRQIKIRNSEHVTDTSLFSKTILII